MVVRFLLVPQVNSLVFRRVRDFVGDQVRVVSPCSCCSCSCGRSCSSGSGGWGGNEPDDGVVQGVTVAADLVGVLVHVGHGDDAVRSPVLQVENFT